MINKIVVNTLLILLALLCIIPFVMVLMVSLSKESDVVMYGYSLIPRNITLDAYKYLFNSSNQIFKSYGITTFVSVVGTLLSMCIMIGIAYPISRADFLYKKQLSMFVFITMVFNGGLAASYVWISNYLHLRDTIAVLILPLLVNSWNVFLLRTYLAAIPTSLIEAAVLDGASEIQILSRIVVPVSKVGIATVSLFTLLTYWNDWFTSMIYIDSAKLVSLQYLLYRITENITFFKNSPQSVKSMLGETLPDETFRMAVAIAATGPMIFVFSFFQKYFVKGILIGSVKG